MHLGIDATNIGSGGGVTHLVQLLSAASPIDYDIQKVTVYAGKRIANAMPTHSWLITKSLPWMDAGIFYRMCGQQMLLPFLLRKSGCDVLFSPGGTIPILSPVPSVVMSQNMLPFEPEQALLFGRWSLMRLKMRLLRSFQGRSLRQAVGIIFLTEYAQKAINRRLGGLKSPFVIVPHGIEARFLKAPRPQRLLSECSMANPFRFLYVSILMPYKHQIEVANAIGGLRAQGLPVEIRFVGESWGGYGANFARELSMMDPRSEFLNWTGHEPFETLHRFYQDSDAFIFASSCENLPNILIEAMASGLPVACSDRGPMQEVLQDAGFYFDPENVSSLMKALLKLIHCRSLREAKALKAWQKVQSYSWQRCATETFAFMVENIGKKKKEIV